MNFASPHYVTAGVSCILQIMANTRFFNGGRSDSGRIGAASEIMRFEIQKKGKLAPGDRYKRIMKKKLDESKKAALGTAYKKPFSLSGKITGLSKMSARTEQALKEIAERKARKEAKAERQMVIIQPRNYTNGTLNKKGDIYDVAGNLVAKVNAKNGKISTSSGWSVGKYKSKSMFTTMVIQGTIDKYSPYFINMRRMQMMQQQGMQPVNVHGVMDGSDIINVHGAMQNSQLGGGGLFGQMTDDSNPFSIENSGPRQNIGVTAWGARSDNVWGTYADNAWGTSTDNVWGTNSTNVWGGVGGGNLWGSKGVKVWGTGNGTNYIKGITNAIAALFGFSNKKNRDTLRALNASVRARTGGSSSSGSTRSAPTSTRTR